MKPIIALAALAALVTPIAAVSPAKADDIGALVRDGVGLPLKVEDAVAGPWTLRTRGRTICALSLTARRAPNGVYDAEIPSDCAAELPAGVVGWKPVTDGMALVGADTSTLIDFNQWTPRDLVARRGGAPYLELTRPKASG